MLTVLLVGEDAAVWHVGEKVVVGAVGKLAVVEAVVAPDAVWAVRELAIVAANLGEKADLP